jgi:hypothetical protein
VIVSVWAVKVSLLDKTISILMVNWEGSFFKSSGERSKSPWRYCLSHRRQRTLAPEFFQGCQQPMVYNLDLKKKFHRLFIPTETKMLIRNDEERQPFCNP